MQPNSYFLKIAGKVSIPEPVILDQNYLISMNCSVTSETKVTNDDGTYDIVFKIEPMTAEILKPNGKIVKAKDPRRNSTKVRNVIYKIWSDRNITQDFDSFYTAVTNRILFRLVDIADEVK